MRWLNASDLRQALPMDEAVAAMEAAFGDDRESPLRIGLGVSLFMAGRVGASPGSRWCRRSRVTRQGSSQCSVPTGIRWGWSTAHRSPPSAPERPADWPLGCWLRPRLVLAMLGAGAMAADQVAAVGRCARSRGSWYGADRESGGGAGGSGWRRGERRRRCGGRGRHRAARRRHRAPSMTDRWHRGRTSTRWCLHPRHGRDPTGDDGTRLRGGGRRRCGVGGGGRSHPCRPRPTPPSATSSPVGHQRSART